MTKDKEQTELQNQIEKQKQNYNHTISYMHSFSLTRRISAKQTFAYLTCLITTELWVHVLPTHGWNRAQSRRHSWTGKYSGEQNPRL